MWLPYLLSNLPDLLVSWCTLFTLANAAAASGVGNGKFFKEHLHFHHARLENLPMATPGSSEHSPQAGTWVRAQSFVLGSWNIFEKFTYTVQINSMGCVSWKTRKSMKILVMILLLNRYSDDGSDTC